MRTGWIKPKEDLRIARRRYKLHYALRKLGNKVIAQKKNGYEATIGIDRY